ncbi:MAG: hypothetical protein MSG64_11445 [Pyrinomonadaceae bacterium MAG19_C2-C3]|nr:hypothetical protein [Pyrinomonadaceae bacterium MAG19_C2-C3]
MKDVSADLYLSDADINRAALEGVISVADAERLTGWGYEQRFAGKLGSHIQPSAPEQRKGFNAVTVAYYSGAMLMISACA